jgi:predicted TIM-barrel fold metal-dependent hydrolase
VHAGVRNFDNLVEAVQRAGVHKVMFGSDGPWIHPGVELAKVRELAIELKLDARATGRLLGHNAVEMFGLNASVQRLVRPPSANAGRAA